MNARILEFYYSREIRTTLCEIRWWLKNEIKKIKTSKKNTLSGSPLAEFSGSTLAWSWHVMCLYNSITAFFYCSTSFILWHYDFLLIYGCINFVLLCGCNTSLFLYGCNTSLFLYGCNTSCATLWALYFCIMVVIFYVLHYELYIFVLPNDLTISALLQILLLCHCNPSVFLYDCYYFSSFLSLKHVCVFLHECNITSSLPLKHVCVSVWL